MDKEIGGGMRICRWKEDEDGLWNTDCGQIFETIDGTPAENKMVFCPFCGAHLEEVVPDQNEAE
jgi:hypothetical protein